MKPGGAIYLDALIHFHGHEKFIMGDTLRIRSLFELEHWQEVQIQRWRLEYDPLEHYPPSATVLKEWPIEISSYPDERVEQAKLRSVWLLAVTARKQN